MHSSNRERLMLILALSAAGLFVADWILLRPALAWRSDMAERHNQRDSEVATAKRLVDLHPVRQRQWDRIRTSSLMPSRSLAEGQVYDQVQAWAQEAGLLLKSVSPDRVNEKGKVPQILFRVSATGKMSNVSSFLEQMEKAEFPIQVSWMQISARTDGEDDLAFDIRLSTLFLPRANGEAEKNDATLGSKEGKSV